MVGRAFPPFSLSEKFQKMDSKISLGGRHALECICLLGENTKIWFKHCRKFQKMLSMKICRWYCEHCQKLQKPGSFNKMPKYVLPLKYSQLFIRIALRLVADIEKDKEISFLWNRKCFSSFYKNIKIYFFVSLWNICFFEMWTDWQIRSSFGIPDGQKSRLFWRSSTFSCLFFIFNFPYVWHYCQIRLKHIFNT